MSSFVRSAAVFLLLLSASCAGPSSPVDPDPRDPTPPGQTPEVDPQVTVSASALSLGADLGEATVTLRNVGGQAVSWTHETSASWLTASPGAGLLAGGATTTVRVAVDRTGLEAGFHAGLLRFVVGEESLEVEVRIEVRPPTSAQAQVSPASIALGADDVSAALTVVNTGTAPLDWSWSAPAWAGLEPSSGTTVPGGVSLVTVVPDRTGLADGSHFATLTLQSNGGTRAVPVSLVVASPARLTVAPGQIDFGAAENGAAVTLRNEGGRPLAWTASDDAGWLTLGAGAGSLGPGASSTLELHAERDGLTPGIYLASVSVVSGGGGGSVGVTLVVLAPEPPGPDPGPDPPAPPPPGSTALAGRVIDQFSGQGVNGLTIQFAGATATTDAAGAFAVPGEASATLRDLSISGPGVYPRATFARAGDTQWRIVPSSFAMGSFDDMAREYEPRTIRWVGSPNVYVDTRPDAFAGGPDLDQWISEVQSQAAAFVSEWTGGTVTAGSVQVGASPPPDGLPGWIVIHFSEDASVYGAPSTVGLARTFWTGDRSISSAIVWLRFVRFSGSVNAGIRSAILGHELGHALGMGHMDGATSSIMTPSVSSNGLTSFDHDAGFLLYTRSPGNTSPDTDSDLYYRGSLGLSREPGFYDWVCGIGGGLEAR